MKSIDKANIVEARIKSRQTVIPKYITPRPLTIKVNGSRSGISSKQSGRLDFRNRSELPQNDPADLLPLLEQQRKDINLIMTSLDELHQDVNYLKGTIRENGGQTEGDNTGGASTGFAEDVILLTENVSKVSGRLSEIDVLKFEMKMMQQRIRRMEEANPMKQRSPSVLEPSLKPSSAARPLVLPSHTPSWTASTGEAATGSGLQVVSSEPATNIVPPRRGSIAARKIPQPSNLHTEGETTKEIPPPQSPNILHRQEDLVPRRPVINGFGTPRPISNNSASAELFPRPSVIQSRSDSAGSERDGQDEVEITHVHSHTVPSKHAHDQSATIHPNIPQPKKSDWPAPPNVNDDTVPARGQISKRRKTTKFDTPSTSKSTLGDRVSRSANESCEENDGANDTLDATSVPCGSENGSQGRRRRSGPGQRDAEGYLLRPDGRRDWRSVRMLDALKRKKAKAAVLGSRLG